MTTSRIGILPKNEEAVMAKKYLVTLTDPERESLLALTKKGSVAARKLTVPLFCSKRMRTPPMTRLRLHIGTATVERTRKRFVEGGVEVALTERPRPGGKAKLAEATLVA